MPEDLPKLPEKPFFSCDADGFSVVDGASMRSASSIVQIQPVLALQTGPANIFEQRPRKVIGHEGSTVTVACDGDETVILDFDDLAARKQTPQGEFMYRGGLDEGNDGRGWMAAR
ncbi:MAG: hypothetical protein WD533_01000 [Dehalococcoidia bacterium]